MKRRLFISAGHTNTPGRDQGAPGISDSEGVLTAQLRKDIVEELRFLGVTASVDKDDSTTGETVKLVRQYFAGKDVLLDIHFNSFANADATGTEALIPANYTEFEKEFAKDLVNTCAVTLSIRNRGVRTELQSARKKLLWMTVPAENIILEVCFISNPHDYANYKATRPLLAKRLAETIVKWLRK